MQLRKIKVKGFLSLKDVTLELSSGLTVLVGMGESGKTALIRAILIVFTNADSKLSVRKGQVLCEVCLTFDTGLEIIWRRKQGKSVGTTSYFLNGHPFTKMGRNVPEEVAKIASPWIVAGKNLGFVQVQEQNPPPFLTTEATAKTGRAWDHLEGRVFREALDACKLTIRIQLVLQTTCQKKLNFYKDVVNPEMDQLDSLYILSQKYIRELNELYNLLVNQKLKAMKKISIVCDLLLKAHLNVLVREFRFSSILYSDGLLEDILNFQQAYLHILIQKIQVPSSQKLKLLPNLLKAGELKVSLRVSLKESNVLFDRMEAFDIKLSESLFLNCPYYKDTGECVLLNNLLGKM